MIRRLQLGKKSDEFLSQNVWFRLCTTASAINHARQPWCTQTFHQGMIQAAPFMNTQQVLLAQTRKAPTVWTLFHRVEMDVRNTNCNAVIAALRHLKDLLQIWQHLIFSSITSQGP